MKASSESGECASLISRVSVVVFEVAWPVMVGLSFVPQGLTALLALCKTLLRDTPLPKGNDRSGDGNERT
jgi:hypothetical protein